MRALAISKYCKPSEYQMSTLPLPEIARPDELLIKVKAAAVNPVDVKMASGMTKILGVASFPYKIGYDLSGVVVAVGDSVKSLKPGDEVFTRLDEEHRGSIAEYAVSLSSLTAKKPVSLSFIEAASLPLVAGTAIEVFDIAEKHFGGSLKGKTVYVPAGLSGTGSMGIQLAKNVYGAGKIITTLSTSKIPKVEQYLGHAVPDQIIDYTKQKSVVGVGKGVVDFMFDTMNQTMSDLPVVKKGGVIVSITTFPSGHQVKEMAPGAPGWLVIAMNFIDWLFRYWTGRKGVGYSFMQKRGNAKILERISQYVVEGKLKPIVGRQAKFSDVEQVKEGCQQIFDAKGGIGKFVVEID
ncbi:hypothetical protein G7Y89_g2917 [Cudoniella acicularis]|uniref:Enoyl reductase (ER) domain-containing protein n=1 Tax=Cudoniella acicularis TaxID=354080 RepID=A0A8H4W629_9HELO|nr:hypothetical protein G7Y89_g2917 [Cudoniella acicularis]